MTQTVYLTMVQDRHCEPEAYPFSTAERAIAYARRTACEFARSPNDVEETQINGWLYYATYSQEGDSVWVVEKEIDVDDG